MLAVCYSKAAEAKTQVGSLDSIGDEAKLKLRNWGRTDYGCELREAPGRHASVSRSMGLRLNFESQCQTSTLSTLGQTRSIYRSVEVRSCGQRREWGSQALESKGLGSRPGHGSARDLETGQVDSQSGHIQSLELSVSKDPWGGDGKPELRFGKFENVRLRVSVSHNGECTVANVLAEHQVSVCVS